MTVTAELLSLAPLTTGGYHTGVGATHFLFPPFGFLLLVLFVGVVGYVAFKSTRGGNSGSEAQVDPAIDVLRHRYAKGEIDEEEYVERRNHLGDE